MSDSSGQITRVSPRSGPPEGNRGAYGGGVPRLGGAPPCPRGGDLSRPALVEAMERGGPEMWEAVTSLSEAVMLGKEEAKRLQEQLAADLRLRRRLRRRPARSTSRDDFRPPSFRHQPGAGLRAASSG